MGGSSEFIFAARSRRLLILILVGMYLVVAKGLTQLRRWRVRRIRNSKLSSEEAAQQLRESSRDWARSVREFRQRIMVSVLFILYVTYCNVSQTVRSQMGPRVT